MLNIMTDNQKFDGLFDNLTPIHNLLQFKYLNLFFISHKVKQNIP